MDGTVVAVAGWIDVSSAKPLTSSNAADVSLERSKTKISRKLETAINTSWWSCVLILGFNIETSYFIPCVESECIWLININKEMCLRAER